MTGFNLKPNTDLFMISLICSISKLQIYRFGIIKAWYHTKEISPVFFYKLFFW